MSLSSLLKTFKILEEELNDLLNQLGIAGSGIKSWPLGGKIALLARNITIHDNFDKEYTGKTH